MRAGVERAGDPFRQDAGERGEAEDAGAEDEGDEHRHLDLEGLDLLAEVLRRPADHQAGDEHRQDGADDEHAVHARTDAAGRDLAELHVEQRDETGDRLEAVVPGVDGAGAGAGRDRREQATEGGTETDLLAFHVAERRLVDGRREQRVADVLVVHRDDGADEQDRRHRREDRPTLALVAGIAPEGVGQRERHHEDGEHLEPVGQRRRVLERVGRVRVEEAAAVVAQLLDPLLGRDRADRRWSAARPRGS